MLKYYFHKFLSINISNEFVNCKKRCQLSNRFGFMFTSVLILCFSSSIIDLVQGGQYGGGGGHVDNEGLYKLLGVEKTATTKEIRVAFKKIALEKHPDKNPEDPNANEEFIKINRAYEILKDAELRKKYDAFGEDGLKDDPNKGQNFHSWNFYNQNFGIYDDDPFVITLSTSDFLQSVESSPDTIWFINFYSAQCSHCHDLAPTWRELAKQLDGVVKIGAVNCIDDWMLCNQQQIQAFPTLIIYPKRHTFTQFKTHENLLNFAMSYAPNQVFELNNLDTYTKEFNRKSRKPWFISFCLPREEDTDDSELNYELNCLDDLIKRKVAAMLHGLVRVGHIDCTNQNVDESICQKLKPSRQHPLAFYYNLPDINNAQSEVELKPIGIDTTDYKQITYKILELLPDVKNLDLDTFENILNWLRDKSKREKPWLIQFVKDYNVNQDLELKKLPTLLSTNYNFARFDCAKFSDPNECFHRFQLTKYPTFVLFKSASSIVGGGVNSMKENWYEVYYSSRVSSHDLAAFVKENAFSTLKIIKQLDLNSLPELLAEENKIGLIVDFFAPWCPPCMNLLPEFRKASKMESAYSFSFATIDCSVSQWLCQQHNVQSYPTIMLFNNTKTYNYFGQHNANDINDFIQDILKPSVVTLTYDSFQKLVQTKPIGKTWFIDFFASWCGPCQQLAPEWRKFAKKIGSNDVFVGQVDCVTEQRLCAEQGVQSYPNIRVYPSNVFGSSSFNQHQGWNRDHNSLFQWGSDFMPSKAHQLDYKSFEKLVLTKDQANNEPWLIDFYAPWCGHCHVFAPKFEIIAAKLEGKVKCGKVNCQDHQYLCQRIGIRGYPSIHFYKLPDSDTPNWNMGENLEMYEVDEIVDHVKRKLDYYGYGKKKISKNSSESKDKDEL